MTGHNQSLTAGNNQLKLVKTSQWLVKYAAQSVALAITHHKSQQVWRLVIYIQKNPDEYYYLLHWHPFNEDVASIV